MPRKRKPSKPLFHLAERVEAAFSIPFGPLSGIPHIELYGDRLMRVEDCRCLLGYTDTVARMQTVCGVLRVEGAGLTVTAYDTGSIVIKGRFLMLTWEGKTDVE